MRSDLRVEVSARKLVCVLDPALLLCHAQGPALAQRLTQVMEPWLTRSFWQALDASELLLARAARSSDPCSVSGSALAQWLALRENTDAGAWVLRWLGDCLAESQLADDADARLLDRFEQLAESLTRRHLREAPRPVPRGGFDGVSAAFDALALSAALDGALVLCEQPDGEAPNPARAARALDLAAHGLEPLAADSLFSAERTLLRHALASAGLAPLLEQRLALAAVHVLPGEEDDRDSADLRDPWRGARVCWYRL